MKTKLVLLGEYVKVVGGYAFKSEDFSDEGIPVIRISDIQDGSVCLDKAARIPKTLVGKGENYYINPGDILIAMSGATTGKIGVVPHNFNDFILQNQRVGNFKIIDSEQVDKRYLKHFVSSPSYQNQIWKSMVGVAQPNISSKQLENFEITFPALEEQKRIAEILDQAEELRSKRREAIAQFDTLTQSIFLEMFGDPKSNPKNWSVKFMAALFATSPIFGTMIPPVTEKLGWLSLRVGNIQNWSLDLSDRKYVDLPPESIERHSVKDGDLLLARAIASQDHLGKCVVAHPCEENWAFDSHLMRLRFDRNLTEPEFIRHLFMTTGGRSLFLSASRKSTVQFNINTKEIAALRIPVPPIYLQQEFTRRIEAVENLKAAHRASLSELDALFASLQHRAFRGDL